MAHKSKTGLDSIILGTVESIDDPTYSGRIKVRVPGLHDNIPTEQLPWCTFGGSPFFSGNGGGSLSVARVGQQVRVQFKSGEKTSMEWMANNQVDPDLINEIKDDYENAQVLIYDSAVDLSIKFQTGTGLILYYQGSFIQIMPDNTITIHYGLGATGTQIQLSKGRVDIQANEQINSANRHNQGLANDAENMWTLAPLYIISSKDENKNIIDENSKKTKNLKIKNAGLKPAFFFL